MHILAGSSRVRIAYKSFPWVHKEEGLLEGRLYVTEVPDGPSGGVTDHPWALVLVYHITHTPTHSIHL